MSRKVETILSPDLLAQVEGIEDKLVVIIDVLRATSTICAALSSGAKDLQPVADVEIARSLRSENCLIAGERNGLKIEGFDLGNSPLEFAAADLTDKSVVLTTTNGTHCVQMAKGARRIVVGSFLNLSAVCDLIDKDGMDVVLFCAGWKGKINLEDSLCAGAICKGLHQDYSFDDASLLCQTSYALVEHDLYRHLKQSSHFQRLSGLGIHMDIEYCCQIDLLEVVPELERERFRIQ